MRLTTRIGRCLACASLLVAAQSAWAGVNSQIGYTDLAARLGASDVPTGAGVVVGQVEAPESPGNYGPNQSDPEFAGKSFTAMSGPPGSSGHATLVAQNLFGNATSIAPGIASIFLYEAGSWASTGYLRTGQGGAVQPLPTPGGIAIFNNSWGGSFGSAATDNDALRRADFVITRDQLLISNGVANALPQNPLMNYMFNAVAVGVSNGTHASGPTPVGYDGPGRQKPEIVAPAQFTSFATPLVNATVALLRETAQTFPGLAVNPNALRSETLKAVLLGGGNHRPGWTNNAVTSGPNRGTTTTPLSPIYGVDVVNVNNSHLILTGLEQEGADSPLADSNIHNVGWDLASVNPAASKYYRFHLPITADSLQITAVWHRTVASNFTSYTAADFTLLLKRIDAAGGVQTLVGDAGLPYFTGGNVVSQSAVDNLEHLYITGLQPGDYLLHVKRNDVLAGAKDVAIAWMIPKKPGDVNGDGFVNIDDLLGVISAWGTCPGCPADLTGGGLVNIDDLLAVINGWG
jgi:hypothetical protein